MKTLWNTFLDNFPTNAESSELAQMKMANLENFDKIHEEVANVMQQDLSDVSGGDRLCLLSEGKPAVF